MAGVPHRIDLSEDYFEQWSFLDCVCHQIRRDTLRPGVFDSSRFWSGVSSLLQLCLVYRLAPEAPLFMEMPTEPKAFFESLGVSGLLSGPRLSYKKGLVPHFGIVGCQTNNCQQIWLRLLTLIGVSSSLLNKVSRILHVCRSYLFQDTFNEEYSNVRKFSTKYQHLPLLKCTVILSLHNSLIMLKTSKIFYCAVILVWKRKK